MNFINTEKFIDLRHIPQFCHKSENAIVEL